MLRMRVKVTKGYIIGWQTGIEAPSETYTAPYVDALRATANRHPFNMDVVITAANCLGAWGLRPSHKAR